MTVHSGAPTRTARAGGGRTGLARWRRLALAVATTLAALALAACGGDDGGDSAGSTAGGSDRVEGSLTLWASLSETSLGEWWEAFIADFEARNPGTEIKLTKYSNEEYLSKLSSSFAAGNEPDLFINQAGEQLARYVRTGKVAALEELVDLTPIARGAQKLYTDADGSIHSVPMTSSTVFLWLNPAIMREHGLETPTTWDDLLSACTTLSEAGVVPIAFGDGGQAQWTAALWYDTLLYQYGDDRLALDGAYGTDGKSWRDPEFVEAADALMSLVDARCFPEGFTGLNYEQMSSIFLRGDAAMIFTGSFFSGQLKAAGTDLEVEIAPLPDAPGAVNSTQSLEGIVGFGSGLAASQAAVDRNPALTAAFLDAVAAAVDDYANRNSLLSAAADPRPSGDPVQAEVTRLSSKAGTLVPVTDIVAPSAIYDDYYQNVQALTAGSLSPEEFAQRMAEAIERERPEFERDQG